MSEQMIEIQVLGQSFRFNCQPEQRQALRDAAKNLDNRVAEMKERTGMLNLDKVLSVVALNLSLELLQEKEKTNSTKNALENQLEQLTRSLESIANRSTSRQTVFELS